MTILPIGTVVNLKNTIEMPVMIIGYFPYNENGDSKDYVSVRYPMGAYDNKMFFFFNHEDIERIIFYGYSDDSFVSMAKLIESQAEIKPNSLFSKDQH